MKSGSFGWRSLRQYFVQQAVSIFAGVALVLCGIIAALRVISDSFVVAVVSAVVFIEFIRKMDRGVPFVHLAAVVAVLQWLVGPLFGYESTLVFDRYQMYVSPDTYFSYALPATCCYLVGLLLLGTSVSPAPLLQMVNRRRFVVIGFSLIAVGNLAVAASSRISGNIEFVLYLVGNFRYVGALYLVFSLHQLRIPFAVLAFTPLVAVSVNTAFFHDMLLWGAICFLYWFSTRRWGIGQKSVLLAVAFFAVFSLQTVKHAYREQLRVDRESASLVNLLIDMMSPGGAGWEQASIENVLVRLNQGWIVSAVLYHVPAEQPFFGGETYVDAFKAALLPRFLAPDKRTADLRINFRRMTGLQILDTTSMGVSPLGEAYANFGIYGGSFALLCYGILLGGFVRATLLFCLRSPTLILWLPVIFFAALKAETESLVVLNQLVKGSIIVAFGLFGVQKLYPVSFRKGMSHRVRPGASISSARQSL